MTGYRNEFRFSGNVVHKYYQEEQKRLILTLSILKRDHSGKGDGTDRVRVNYPTVLVQGEMAVKLNEKISTEKKFQFVEMICHAASEYVMRYAGDGNYKKERRLVFVVDEILGTDRFVNVNDACISGKVMRSWHSDDPDKKFYLVDVECGRDRFQVTCFDQNMMLDPKVGEGIMIFAEAQTARREIQAQAGERKTSYYMTIVARTVLIERGDGNIAA